MVMLVISIINSKCMYQAQLLYPSLPSDISPDLTSATVLTEDELFSVAEAVSMYYPIFVYFMFSNDTYIQHWDGGTKLQERSQRVIT